tara:strand:- start:494315 stop:495475 length:1161 start_codon:yes stop_codon:yes gene_type:complete
MTPRPLNTLYWRHYLALALLLGLVLLCWSGFFDELSNNTIDSALASAGIIYASARGINALVSVLQGTEINAVVLTIAIGEMLDPVNDLIERFSGVMLIALGSLAIQKILLGIVSHHFFNLLLSAVAVLVGVGFLLQQQAIKGAAIRLFIALAVLRFSLGLVVLASGWVDTAFMAAQDNRRYEAMQSFQGELRAISTVAGVGSASQDAVSATQSRIDRLAAALLVEQDNMATASAALRAAQSRLDEIMARESWWDTLNPLSEPPAAVRAARREVTLREESVESAALMLASIDDTLQTEQEALDCLRKQQAGETCGLMKGIVASASPTRLAARIGDLEEKVSDFSGNLIALLMSALLKSLLIPLMFFYVITRGVKALWSATGQNKTLR